MVRTAAGNGVGANTRRKSYARTSDLIELPRLIEIQLQSFEWFRTKGLNELFEEISPIVSFNKHLELHFGEFRFDDAKHTEDACRVRDITYSAPLWVQVKLVNNDTGEISEQEVFMGDFPLMTDSGTFIVNGSERVVVSQLIRSPGVYFTVEEDRSTGRELTGTKLIPGRGAWLEFETSKRDIISVKVDRKRKLPVTILLRAIGYGTDEEIRALFADVDDDDDHSFIEATLERDPTANPTEDSQKGIDDALLEFYKKLRPGDPPTLDNARNFVQNLLFSSRRYDLGRVGRYKLNRKLGLETPLSTRILTQEDMVEVIRRIIDINNGRAIPDDIDHLGNRRIKTVGELIQTQLRIGLLRMERVVRERMSIREPEQVTPLSLINIRPVVAATREFFGSSQLSQFMDQTNPLAELTHKRRLSALGPGGLRRERAGFDVRDVHYSHYGRICPIETPEGPNIGLIGYLATFGRINEFGFIETPYRRVLNVVENRVDALAGRILAQDVTDPDSGEVLVEKGAELTPEFAQQIAALEGLKEIRVQPFVSDEVVYLDADAEERPSDAGASTLGKKKESRLVNRTKRGLGEAEQDDSKPMRPSFAQASTPLDNAGHFLNKRPSVRQAEEFRFEEPQRIQYMDVSPKQVVGVSAALIPFLEHDDTNRALMGSNMQRQAVPLVQPEAPIVGTGMEWQAAVDSGQVVVAHKAGEAIRVVNTEIIIQEDDGALHSYPLRKYNRSNQSTCIDQRPTIQKGDRVEVGTVLADSSSTQNGELALGQNVLVAYMSWEGGNYEDAILVSERLVENDKYTSVHIEKHEIEARETKLGPEEITRDIPNVGEDALRHLDEDGIIRIGAEVTPGDILVGKITPKGETELTPEEKLLRAIFGEKAREVKDSSLRLPHGERGKIVDIKVFTRDDHQDMPAGVEKMVRVSIAQRRRLTEGDKMAGRHGNKGVISRVVPVEDMPFLEDGTPIDIILNPLGVPGRMNIGQILETHLGWAADRLGFMAETPVFDGAKEDEIESELARAWLIDRAWQDVTQKAWAFMREQEIDSESLKDDSDARSIYLLDWLEPRGYEAERLFFDDAYARNAALSEWLQDKGYEAEHIIPETRSDASDQYARYVALREWMLYHGGELDGLDGAALEELDATLLARVAVAAQQHSKQVGWPLPSNGKQKLFDGKTGEPYDAHVTIGIAQMLKLNHLVEDKVHARSTGPYSLVTQQPLGGKAQFGGQRFGEMEVWALEAYGAAYTLQEMLTIKSDDTTGRVKTYEAIVKGDEIQSPGVPESFRVLVKELQSLALSIEVINDKNEVIHLGKDEAEDRLPHLGFSLNVPSPMSRSSE